MSYVTFYRNDPNAPRCNMKTHLGANAVITWDGKLLLEKRRDSDSWGLVGGGVRKTETGLDAIVREVYEELGLRIGRNSFRKLKVYGKKGRIASYRDGSTWQMVIVVYGLELTEKPELSISSESKDAAFFTKDEVRRLNIPVTHSDIVEELFLNV